MSTPPSAPANRLHPFSLNHNTGSFAMTLTAGDCPASMSPTRSRIVGAPLLGLRHRVVEIAAVHGFATACFRRRRLLELALRAALIAIAHRLASPSFANAHRLASCRPAASAHAVASRHLPTSRFQSRPAIPMHSVTLAVGPPPRCGQVTCDFHPNAER